MRLCGALLLLVIACQSREQSSGPLVAVDDAGDTVRLGQPARRVVSLVPATTELLFAIGAGPQLVGRTKWCDYPAEALAVSDVGDGLNPNLEAVIAQRPDLVVMYFSGANAAAAERFRALGVPALQLSVDRLADVERVAAILGRLTGHEASVDSVVRRLNAELAEATVPRDSAAPRVLIVAWDQPPIAIGRGSFMSEMVERAGGINIFDDLSAPSAQVSIETVVARDPDALLVSSDGPPGLASRPEWQVVPAVREGRFIHVESSGFSRPSPRAPEVIRELSGKLKGLRP